MGGDQTMLIAGIGCRRGCPAEDIVALVARAAAGRPVTALATAEFKAAEAGVLEAARLLGVALIPVHAAALAAVQARCVTRSATAWRATGFASVAEGSALAAAGVRGRLVQPRIAAGGATCALAEVAA
jgi:cobalt-precorrin 5A hydrolase